MDHETVATIEVKKVRIRPVARRTELRGRVLPPIDDWWRIKRQSSKKLTLVNYRTNQGLALRIDDITQLRADPDGRGHGLLFLKGQVVLRGSTAYVEAEQGIESNKSVLVRAQGNAAD